MPLPAIAINTINTILTAIAGKLFDAAVTAFSAKYGAKTAEQEAAKLFYRSYREIKSNLAVLDGLRPGAFAGQKVNSPACRELAAAFKTEAMTALLEQAAGNPKLVSAKNGAVIASLDKAVRYTENFAALTALSDTLLSLRRHPRIEGRLKHIKEQHLAAYTGLFKQ